MGQLEIALRKGSKIGEGVEFIPSCSCFRIKTIKVQLSLLFFLDKLPFLWYII